MVPRWMLPTFTKLYFGGASRRSFANIAKRDALTFDARCVSLTPDETWNLSPHILGLLERRLLDEPYNPLSLLKCRIIDYMQSQCRTSGKISIPLLVHRLAT
uniref:Uncharacterized protein n=1 Tax=Parascaris equorum TaxID=6256 RepID=A0A914R4U5_PAREQ